MIKIIRVISEEEILEECKITEVTILEEDIEVASGMINLAEVEVGPEKDSIQITLRDATGSRANTSRDWITCFKCREYDHFAKDCPNMTETEKEQTEQMQQMLDLEEDKTALKILVADTYKYLIRTNSEEAIDHLN